MSKCLCFLLGWQWLIIMNSLFPPRQKQSYRITENNLQAHGSVFHHRRSMGIVSSRCHWLRRCWRHSFGLCRWQTATHLEPWMRSFLSFREAGCFVKDMGQMPAQIMFNYSIFATVNARNWSKIQYHRGPSILTHPNLMSMRGAEILHDPFISFPTEPGFV